MRRAESREPREVSRCAHGAAGLCTAWCPGHRRTAGQEGTGARGRGDYAADNSAQSLARAFKRRSSPETTSHTLSLLSSFPVFISRSPSCRDPNRLRPALLQHNTCSCPKTLTATTTATTATATTALLNYPPACCLKEEEKTIRGLQTENALGDEASTMNFLWLCGERIGSGLRRQRNDSSCLCNAFPNYTNHTKALVNPITRAVTSST